MPRDEIQILRATRVRRPLSRRCRRRGDPRPTLLRLMTLLLDVVAMIRSSAGRCGGRVWDPCRPCPAYEGVFTTNIGVSVSHYWSMIQDDRGFTGPACFVGEKDKPWRRRRAKGSGSSAVYYSVPCLLMIATKKRLSANIHSWLTSRNTTAHATLSARHLCNAENAEVPGKQQNYGEECFSG